MSVNVNIFSSLWAICPPNYAPFKNICCIKEDGSLDEDKYWAFMRIFAACGANNTRCLPFLVNEDWETVNPEYMPFRYRGKDTGYDITLMNPTYFINIKKMAQISNSFGIRFWLSLFDTAHGKRGNSPWKHNCNGVNGFHNLSEALIEAYLEKILYALKNNVVGYEAVNEPALYMAQFTADISLRLLYQGVPIQHIMSGHRFMSPNQPEGNETYEATKRHLKQNGFHNGRKHLYYSKVVHGVDIEWLREYAFIQKHTSRFFISNDGVKPRWNNIEWKKSLEEFFSQENNAPPVKKNKQFGLWIGFEHLCTIPQYATGEEADSIRMGALGISQAIEEYAGEKLYKDIIPPFEPGIPTPIPMPPSPGTIEERVEILERKVKVLEEKLYAVPGYSKSKLGW